MANHQKDRHLLKAAVFTGAQTIVPSISGIFRRWPWRARVTQIRQFYLRTQQTAQPTIERFPEVPVAVWPIQEFTYLEPSRWLPPCARYAWNGLIFQRFGFRSYARGACLRCWA